MTTFIVVEYCSGCDLYYKHIGSREASPCEVCGELNEFKSVEKYGEHDPNIKEEVLNVCYNENPRYSATLGVSETQIKQAMKLHPGTEWKKFGHSYRPLIKTRTDKLRLMKEANYEEYPPNIFKGRN